MNNVKYEVSFVGPIELTFFPFKRVNVTSSIYGVQREISMLQNAFLSGSEISASVQRYRTKVQSRVDFHVKSPTKNS